MTEKSFRFYLAHSSLLFYEDILKQISSHRQTFQVLKLKQTATVVAEPTIGAILQIAVNDVKANILWVNFVTSKILHKNENDNLN